MNEKINLQDLSALLAKKAAITKKEADTFLREYFELMSEELINSGLLKIKDLGAFKLAMMEDRESIDVTTGERVLIPAHYKVVFTPDKKLAEVVNEPFSLFETIEIEDDFDMGELELLSKEDTSKDSEQESEFASDDDEEAKTAFQEEPIVEKEDEVVFRKEPIIEEEENIIFEKEPAIEEEEDLVPEEEPTLEKEEDLVPEEEPILEDDEELDLEEEPTVEEDDELDLEEEPIIEDEKEEFIFGKEPIAYEDDDIDFRKEPIIYEDDDAFRKDQSPDENEMIKDTPLSKYEKDLERESLLKKYVSEYEEPSSDEKSIRDWRMKNFCLNCHDYKAHHSYRKKYFKTRKLLTRLRIIVGALSVLLLAAAIFILYMLRVEEPVVAQDDSSPASVISGYIPEKKGVSVLHQKDTTNVIVKDTIKNSINDATTKVSVTISDSIVSDKPDKNKVPEKVITTDSIEKFTKQEVKEEKPKKNDVAEKVTPPKTSEKSKQVTVTTDQRLTTISLKEYGSKVFWIYIYLENKDKISDPNVLPVGTKITIPPASKYGIDSKNPNSVNKAKETTLKVLKNF